MSVCIENNTVLASILFKHTLLTLRLSLRIGPTRTPGPARVLDQTELRRLTARSHCVRQLAFNVAPGRDAIHRNITFLRRKTLVAGRIDRTNPFVLHIVQLPKSVAAPASHPIEGIPRGAGLFEVPRPGQQDRETGFACNAPRGKLLPLLKRYDRPPADIRGKDGRPPPSAVRLLPSSTVTTLEPSTVSTDDCSAAQKAWLGVYSIGEACPMICVHRADSAYAPKTRQ